MCILKKIKMDSFEVNKIIAAVFNSNGAIGFWNK